MGRRKLTDLCVMSAALSGAVVARLGQASHALRSRQAAALMLPAFVVGPPRASRRPKVQPAAGSLRAFRNVGGSGDKTARGESSPVNNAKRATSFARCFEQKCRAEAHCRTLLFESEELSKRPQK